MKIMYLNEGKKFIKQKKTTTPKKYTQCKHENSISSFDMNQNHTRTETNIEKCAHNVWYESNMEFGIASKSNKSSRDDVWICGRTRDRKNRQTIDPTNQRTN